MFYYYQRETFSTIKDSETKHNELKIQMDLARILGKAENVFSHYTATNRQQSN